MRMRFAFYIDFGTQAILNDVLTGAMAESPCVKVFGCRPVTCSATNSAAWGRRSKTSKGGNRGKGYVLRLGVRYRELSAAPNFDFEAGCFSTAAGLECVHNFCVMA
jgi:hypothetical protein